MGKKVKKDEKAAPDDVFDALQVESRQAATAVLMLDSPEEDVLSKACESIYKFAEKCDDNKKNLLDLGAVDSLLKLIQHEDRIVRRNACSAFSVLTAHPEVRKVLRKEESAIPSIINLLAPEEETLVHEFAALALSSLATEFSTTVSIWECGGVEPLVRCLGSPDPDVQKNAIEALAKLLLDFQTRSALREYDGLRPILELLKSEFAVIQQLALLALDRAAQDAENRSLIRELEGVSRLIDFVAHPEWNDLHVQAVMVLSSLLEDTESLEVLKETGGLKKLVNLITDKAAMDEEAKAKGGGAEKKGGSRAAKRSAKGDGKKKDEESHDNPFGESIVPTLPDVKMCTAKAIARSAKNAENRKILHEQETEKMLIHLLSHENADVIAAAAQALAIMCENLLSRDAIREWEGFPPLIKLLHHDQCCVKEAVTLTLANLTTGNNINASEVVSLNGLEPLISLLGDGHDSTVANVACVLTNLAQDETNRAEAQAKGVVTALIPPLKTSSTTVQAKAALGLAAYVCDTDSRTALREAGGLEPLVALLTSCDDEVRRNSAWAVSVCAVDEPTAAEICRLGGMATLQEIQLSTTRQNAFAAVALEKLLDNNLSAKYALTGRLSAANGISNGFYDAGQLRPGSKFLPLEEYGKQELNEKLAVLLVNALPNPSTLQQQSDLELKTDASKTSISGKSSRTGRESKTKTKAQREREEKQKEEELQAQLQKEMESEDKPYSPPPDPSLLKYIEEVVAKIQPIPSLRQQVQVLAQYVSEKLGGAIERGQVSNFSWELPMSQVKFELKSNVVPIGKIKAGIHVHRALLFKVLADKIALPCTLVRGEYYRAWNEVLLPTEPETPSDPVFPPKWYVVDLVHNPGGLLLADSIEATNYQKL
ncbi:LOW QUALITY PROTEIN: armadillo repeat-containing protein 3-like [Liolophura sinensis]|uniref:LOW QUALITY PROTEIN: armadillo repeat-containing protein 3-like n=1 Tax=Liolophura sinensis TaxID=3198878 RepID=UPI0031586014